MTSIYLDNNSTTPLLPAVHEAMSSCLISSFGNPASAHHAGRRARVALEDAREQIAALLGAHADEVIFTSGATEANNLALLGLTGEPPGYLIASPLEHPSVIEPLHHLARSGFELSWLPASPSGSVSANDLAPLLRPDTRLVSVMLANHETGAIQPVRQLADALTDSAVLFHCDATQAAGKIAIDFHALNVTSLSLSGHKFHGPRGIGVLLLKRGARLRPLHHGGHQQQGRRPGTEPVALAVGLAAALDLACKERQERTEHVRSLRQRFLDALHAGAAPVRLNGPDEEGVPHTLNLSFPGVEANVLLMALDLAEIAASTGSACSSGSLLPSPVLCAMGVSEENLRSAMRFSLSHLNTGAEIDQAARRICQVIQRLRQGAEHP
jgi:cysteine desulfurase